MKYQTQSVKVNGRYVDVPLVGQPTKNLPVLDLSLPIKENRLPNEYVWKGVSASPLGRSHQYRHELLNLRLTVPEHILVEPLDMVRHRSGEAYREWSAGHHRMEW